MPFQLTAMLTELLNNYFNLTELPKLGTNFSDSDYVQQAMKKSKSRLT
jgi:hypothetical protein